MPGVNLGRSDGPELNKAADYLAGIVAENNLPRRSRCSTSSTWQRSRNIRGLKPRQGGAGAQYRRTGGPEQTEEYTR